MCYLLVLFSSFPLYVNMYELQTQLRITSVGVYKYMSSGCQSFTATQWENYMMMSPCFPVSISIK